MQLKLEALPSLLGAVVLPLLGVVTLLVERGSRRGRGLAGLQLCLGAASCAALFVHAAGPHDPPPVLATRLMFFFGFLSGVPMVDFFGDLAERAGVERALGVPPRHTEVVQRIVVTIVSVLTLVPRILLRDVAYQAGSGWRAEWSWTWLLFAPFGILYIVWGLACWNGERRRRGQLEADLVIWLVALALLVVGPFFMGAFLPAAGVRHVEEWTPAVGALGAVVTLVGLFSSRDLELRRLRSAVSPSTSPSGNTAARPSASSSTTGPRVLACESCGATFTGMPESGTCPLDAGTVRTGPDPLVDSIIDGRYRVLRFLGAGGMARVYVAEHARLGTRFAIKVLWGEMLADRSMAERFLREARTASPLVSPHIVRVHDVGEVRPGIPYLALELLDGPSLGDSLRQRGALAAPSVALLGAQLADGLAVAHAAGIVHRDLKPENVILVRAADRDVAKIVDFGLAKSVGPTTEARLTATGTLFGTPLYMAPEQVRGEAASAASDLYGLGMLLYEAAAGAHPFAGETPMQVLFKHVEVVPGRVPLDGGLGDLVMRLLQKDPAVRATAEGDLSKRFLAFAQGARRFEPRGATGHAASGASARPIPDTIAERPGPPV